MAIEILKGLIRASLKTEPFGEFTTSNFFITKDEEGGYKVSFCANQYDHDKAEDGVQYFSLSGLKQLRDFLDEVITSEEETD